MITVYVGDVGEYLSTLCRSVDLNAKLITQENFANLTSGTYYTSIADLGTLSNFGSVLRQANKIVYAPPSRWSDWRNKKSDIQNWTEDYLNAFRFRCDVENFVPDLTRSREKILSLIDDRRVEKPQLWIAGCSISHGDGVEDNERYGQLLADLMGLEVSFLTASGSSIIWAADQILRSDIRANDIVIWGLTDWSRTPFFKNNSLIHINTSTILTRPEHSKLINPDILTSDYLFYQALTNVYQVINYCDKIKATLILPSLLDGSLCNYISDHPGFMMLCNFWGRDRRDRFIDSGNDNVHPGPLTHKFYADQIFQKIQQLVVKT